MIPGRFAARRHTRPRACTSSLHVELLEPRQLLAEVAGLIASDTRWNTADSPYVVTGDITVARSATLSIQPGVRVEFRSGTGITVLGRLLAEGTAASLIVFDRAPGSSRWDGLTFRNTLADNRIAFADMIAGDAQGEAIRIDRSRLLLDNIRWSATQGTILELEHPSLIVRNSQFPRSSGAEIIHGEHLSGDEYLIVEGNVFANSNNGGDVIDFLGADRPGPVLEVLNNVFLGGGDDGLDLDGTDAHIEGNLFMNFRRNTSRNTTSNAIATGLPQSGESNRTEITVVRNVFLDSDHALLLKEDAFATVENNVFVGMRQAVIQFAELDGTAVMGPGKGAGLDGNIFWNNARLFVNLVNQPGFRTELTADRSLMPNEPVRFGSQIISSHDLGAGNLEGDPLFVNPAAGDFRLQPQSPARGTGPHGRDMGAMVPGGPMITGIPEQPSFSGNLTAIVSGPGITHYRYRLNDQPYGPLTTVDAPIVLRDLGDGAYTLDVVALNSAGQWFAGQTPALGQRSSQFVVPSRTRVGERLPIVLRLRDNQGQLDSTFSATGQLNSTGQLNGTDIRITKGVATSNPMVTAAADFALEGVGAWTAAPARPVHVLDDTFPTRSYSGTLTGSVVWTGDVEHRVVGDLVIPSGSRLTIEADARVLLGDRVNLRIEGDLVVQGTAEHPVLFGPFDPALPWGGIELVGGSADVQYTFFTGGGADNSKTFGHSRSQPVILANGATLDCRNCYIIHNVGKGLGSTNDAAIQLRDSIIAYVDTGGEFQGSLVNVRDSYVMNIPNDDGTFVDDDNDGFYFSGVHSSGNPSRFERSVVHTTKDDCLDHNGARLEVQSSWLEGCLHEGVAASNSNWVTIDDTVVIGNSQGIEAGYGGPQVTVTQSVLFDNRTTADPAAPITAGLRFGDGYDGALGAYRGHITADRLVIHDNGDNVRNFDGTIPGPQPGAIELTHSLANDNDVAGEATNLSGTPVFGPRMHLLRGSAGFASAPDGTPLGRTIPPTSVRFQVTSDLNGDAAVDAADIDRLCAELNAAQTDLRFDLTGDGLLDQADRDRFVLQRLGSTYGDANLDRRFDTGDLVLVFQRGEYEDGIAANSTWSDGDWECNGEFDTADLILAFRTGGFEAAGAAAVRLATRAAVDRPDVQAALAAYGSDRNPRAARSRSSDGEDGAKESIPAHLQPYGMQST